MHLLEYAVAYLPAGIYNPLVQCLSRNDDIDNDL
jgi:hypothetical protein